MASPIVPFPPKGYKPDVQPPAGYNLDAPISSDLEDRRGKTPTPPPSNTGTFVRDVWDQVKREVTPSYYDNSFYDPKKDASHH